MKGLHVACWLAVWLLSPSRGNILLKSAFIGTVLKLLSLLLIPILLVLRWLLGHLPDTGDDQPVTPLSGHGILLAVFVAPLVETALMAMVFGLGGLVALPRAVPVAVIVVGAVLLHPYDFALRVLVTLLFSAMSAQYVLFRTQVSAVTTLVCVAVTHGTFNLLSLLCGALWSA